MNKIKIKYYIYIYLKYKHKSSIETFIFCIEREIEWIQQSLALALLIYIMCMVPNNVKSPAINITICQLVSISIFNTIRLYKYKSRS